MSDGPVFAERKTECCGGTCRLAEIRRMTEDELMDALVNAEEERDMAIAEVDRLSALRVAGPDDLVIRREDIDYEAAKRAAFEMAEQIAQARYGGQRLSLTEVNDLKVRAAVDAALAAAEGEET